MVRRLKFDGDFAAGQMLAREMAFAALPMVRSAAWRRAVLVGVPLHRSRLRERGFDQAQFLAIEIGRRLNLVVASGVLRRVRATLPQGDPRVTSRSSNIDGAFAIRAARAIRGQHVLLIDDVITSGATARACALQLQANGAVAVALVTACQA